MLIKKFNDIRLIKSEWVELYDKNPTLTPYQSYTWNLLLQTQFRHTINWLSRSFINGYARIEYWTFSENENYAIAPLIIYTNKAKIHIFGQQEDLTDYLSFIFNDKISERFLIICLQTLLKEYPQFSFVFDRINESNRKMSNVCMKVFAKSQKKHCVKIAVIDDLISKVKLHPRRYWKKGLNRIDTDSLMLSFSFNQMIIEEKELNFLLHHYKKRKTNKNNYSLSKQFLLYGFQFLHNCTGNKNDMVSLFCSNNAEIFVAKCLINNHLAAYMLCISRNDTLYLLRISFDDNFFKYRPGILLLVETINHLFKNIPTINFFDLTRGDDSYKLEYGGYIHYNYCFA